MSGQKCSEHRPQQLCFLPIHQTNNSFLKLHLQPYVFWHVCVCVSICVLGWFCGCVCGTPSPRARIIDTDCYALPFMWVLIWIQVFRLGQQELFSCIFFFAWHRVSLSCPHCCSLTHSVGPGRPWTWDLLLCLLSYLHSTFFEHSVHRSPINRKSFGY